MDAGKDIKFAVSDQVDGEPISPTSITLGLISEFTEEVQAFLRGTSKGFRVARLKVEVVSGSYAYRLAMDSSMPTNLVKDLQALEQPDSLDRIDPKRAEVVLLWQKRAKADPDRSYSIGTGTSATVVQIDTYSSFRYGNSAVWVAVEKYLLVKIVNMGGVTRPNLHAIAEDGTKLKIAASEHEIARQERNLLYRPVVIRVRAEQNISTDALRNLSLISFEEYQPAFDLGAFEDMTSKGAAAWSDITDHVEWVRSLRGH